MKSLVRSSTPTPAEWVAAVVVRVNGIIRSDGRWPWVLGLPDASRVVRIPKAVRVVASGIGSVGRKRRTREASEMLEAELVAVSAPSVSNAAVMPSLDENCLVIRKIGVKVPDPAMGGTTVGGPRSPGRTQMEDNFSTS